MNFGQALRTSERLGISEGVLDTVVLCTQQQEQDAHTEMATRIVSEQRIVSGHRPPPPLFSSGLLARAQAGRSRLLGAASRHSHLQKTFL